MKMKDPNQAPRMADGPMPVQTPMAHEDVTRREIATRSERFGLYITNAVGTLRFFFLLFLWTFGWLAWNALAPKALRFDPYPAFVLWLFLSNMIQLFLMPLVLIGQGIQSRASDKRVEADLAISRRAKEQLGRIEAELRELKGLIAAGGSAAGGESNGRS